MRAKTWPVKLGLASLLLMFNLAAFAPAETPLYFGSSGIVPHASDYTGDGYNEMGAFDATTGLASVHQINGEELVNGFQVGLAGYQPAFGDYDGDGLTDPASYDPVSGCWYSWLSGSHYQMAAFDGVAGTATTTIHPADYDGDGLADPALYDSALGVWVIYSSPSDYQPAAFYHLAGPHCQAVPMDYDGDRKADPAVYDGATGLWAVNFSSQGYALQTLTYGGPGCAPAPADFDGDSKADPTVYCAALGIWGTLNSAGNFTQSLVIQGGPGCVPVPGKYYFTNSASYAVFNPTNQGWYIAYTPVYASANGFFSWMFKKIASGAVSAIGSQAVGWGLNKIFHHGEDPSDPHWAEEQQLLSEMNQKLDQLLTGQQVITNMLWQLSQQLEYDKTEIELLIRQTLAEQAFVTIQTYYDQHGTDGYASFYQCDTNNTPTCAEVDHFVTVIQNHNIKESVNAIYRTILPGAGNTNGVLRLWAAMAKPRITPDTLLDHYQSLFYYFATLYNYQMKGACLYVDTERVHGTSAWAQASIAAYITNDLANIVQAEVSEFRAITYDYVLTAINASYNPGSTNNPMLVTNVAETLASLEFFTRQWLGESGIATTIISPEDKLSAYPGCWILYFEQIVPSPVYRQIPGVMTTNWAAGRPYGYANAASNQVIVSDRYAFLRCNFTNVPRDAQLVYTAGTLLGYLAISNYDEMMQPTEDPTITNYFGHVYASPVNMSCYPLPLDTARSWASRWNYVNYYAGTQPSHRDCWYEFTNPESLTNFYMKALMYYDMRGGWHNPSGLGVWPWDYAMVYPIAISNRTASAVKARAFFTVEDSQSRIARWDDHGAWNEEWWSWHDCGGFAAFSGGASNTWTWQRGDRKRFHAGQTTPDQSGSSTNRYEGVAQVLVSGTNTATSLYIGGQLYVQEDCWEGAVTPGFVPCYVQGEVYFKLKNVVLSFY